MTKGEAEILFFIIAVIIIWQVIKTINKLVDQVTDYLLPTPPEDWEWVRNAPYTSLIEHSIRYTNDILFNYGLDHFPSYKIYYRRHKKHFGRFTNEVVIYTKNHSEIKELVDTCLHEVAHYIQSKTKTDYNFYDSYTKQYGAWDNPLEVEAREFASRHLNECLLYLEEKGLVKRG